MAKDDHLELMKLYRARLHDRKQAQTRRRKDLHSRPKTMKDLVSSYFQQDSEALRRIEESKGIHAWVGYVGLAASRVSYAIKVRNNTLIVRVSDPLWMQQLSLLKYELIKKYQRDYPRLGVKDIYFVRQ